MCEFRKPGFLAQAKELIARGFKAIKIPAQRLLLTEGRVMLNSEEMCIRDRDEIYTTLGRAVRLNKSLLLLSRIENGQYTETEDVSVDEVLDELLPDLMDIYEGKKIHLVRTKETEPFVIRCNLSLAQILVSNLVKNSLVHNREGGELHIATTPSSLTVSYTHLDVYKRQEILYDIISPLNISNIGER